MKAQNYYEGINHIIYISTNIGTGCEHCNARIGLEKLAESINHYIEKHGYKLLHVGTETICDKNGNPSHTTIALVGK